MFERLWVQEGLNLGGGESRAGVAMDTGKNEQRSSAMKYINMTKAFILTETSGHTHIQKPLTPHSVE